MSANQRALSSSDFDPLLARAIAGEAAALSRLLERFGPAVRERLKGSIAAHWQSSLDDADVMQVTYLEAFLSIRDFQPAGPSAFEAWLTRIARNNLQSAIRGLSSAKRPDPRKQLHAAPSEDARTTLIEALAGTDATPSSIARRQETLDALDKAIHKLPPDYERVVRLYDLEGQSVEAVAATMARSAGAVYMLRARAHDRLRELLGPIFGSSVSGVSGGV